jgi:nitroreductase
MGIKHLVKMTRSYRRFEQKSVGCEVLSGLVDCARVTASAANLQPLKYIVSSSPEINDRIFECTAWAGYLKEWGGPANGERPVAYIVILEDPSIAINAAVDVGIAAQTIVLAAAEQGIGACMIGSLKRDRLRESLEVPAGMRIALVIALGYPAEEVVLEDIGDNGVKYYRDANGVHHVPKRRLDEVLIDVRG